NNKVLGVTMALIGVLIALSAAMVGSERNALTRNMIQQTQAHADLTAASAKYRVVLIEIERQGERLTNAREAQGGWSPVERYLELAGDYGDERELARKWADSYEPLVDGHFEAAERYEHAQLIAEIAIVLASLSVLLSSRIAWVISLVVAAACVAQ